VTGRTSWVQSHFRGGKESGKVEPVRKISGQTCRSQSIPESVASKGQKRIFLNCKNDVGIPSTIEGPTGSRVT